MSLNLIAKAVALVAKPSLFKDSYALNVTLELVGKSAIRRKLNEIYEDVLE